MPNKGNYEQVIVIDAESLKNSYILSYVLLSQHLCPFLLISYLKRPIIDDISTHNSDIAPPIEPAKILYISINGDETRMVVRTSLIFVKENEKVLSIIAHTIKSGRNRFLGKI